MGIYHEWIASEWHYAIHLMGWMLPIVLLQWLGFAPILRANLKAIIRTTLIVGTYLIGTDVVAIHYGVWFFDPEQILGIAPLGVPIEEWFFFYLTALLVAQSFVLFVPGQLRHAAPGQEHQTN